MKNKDKSLKKTSDLISEKISDRQEKNRAWWESLPMTYADWDSKERIPKNKEDFISIEKKFLDGNPYIRDKFNFSITNNLKVLEIGCGSGAASCLFSKSGAKVTSVDITKNAVEITKKNAKLQGLKLRVLQSDAEKLILEDEEFDYVFSWGVLHHSQNTISAFKEAIRVLKSRGKGLIMVYNQNSARYYLNGLNWLILKGKIFNGYNLRTVQDFYTDGYYHRHFTPNGLRKTLESLGVKCTKIVVTHMGGYRMLPLLPLKFENWLKNNYGWLLVAEFEKI